MPAYLPPHLRAAAATGKSKAPTSPATSPATSRPTSPAAARPPASVDGALVAGLERLARLRDAGSLSPSEFAAAKQHLLVAPPVVVPPASASADLVMPPGHHKTALCTFFANGGKCKNGTACTYAHGAAELRSLRPQGGGGLARYETPFFHRAAEEESDGGGRWESLRCQPVDESPEPAAPDGSLQGLERALAGMHEPAAAAPVASDRPGSGSLHKTAFCGFFARGYCRNGSACTYAHGPAERRWSRSSGSSAGCGDAFFGPREEEHQAGNGRWESLRGGEPLASRVQAAAARQSRPGPCAHSAALGDREQGLGRARRCQECTRALQDYEPQLCTACAVSPAADGITGGRWEQQLSSTLGVLGTECRPSFAPSWLLSAFDELTSVASL